MGSFFGWTLESSLLVVMILGIRRAFMGKVRYAGIYALWLVILLRLLVPVNVISTPFSIGDMVSQKVSSWNLDERAGQDGGSRSFSGGDKVPRTGIRSLIDVDSTEMLSGGGRNGECGNIPRSMEAISEDRWAGTLFFQKLAGMADWRKILPRAWVAVSGGLLLWFLLSNLRLMRRLRKSRTLWGRRNRVKIYAVSEIKNPCLYGFFRPVIYIPENLIYGKEQGGDEELEQIITHEYVHYQHRDHIWGMFRLLLVSAYWFHPFVWLAVSCSKKDAELFCDETVIATLGEERRFSYGEMLVRLAGEARWGDFRYSMMPMSRRGREMERRIRAISDRRSYSRWVLFPLLLILAGTVGITCSTGVGPLAKGKLAEEKRSGIREEAVRQKDTKDASGIGAEGEMPISSGHSVSQYQKRLNELSRKPGDMSGGKREEGQNSAISSDGCKEAFERYIQTFTAAVNTGDTGQMHQVLAEGSQVYEQQCALVKNYHKRGIREEVEKCSITSVRFTTFSQAKIHSRERIKVLYGDATTKVVKQKYQYTCEMVDGEWIITEMQEL